MRVKKRVYDVDKMTKEIESNMLFLIGADNEYALQLLGVDISKEKQLIQKIARHRAESFIKSNANRRQ